MTDIEIIFLEFDGEMLYICNGQGNTTDVTQNKQEGDNIG